MGGGKEAAERDRGGGRGGAAAASAQCEARLAGALSEAKFTQQVVSKPECLQCSASAVPCRSTVFSGCRSTSHPVSSSVRVLITLISIIKFIVIFTSLETPVERYLECAPSLLGI